MTTAISSREHALPSPTLYIVHYTAYSTFKGVSDDFFLNFLFKFNGISMFLCIDITFQTGGNLDSCAKSNAGFYWMNLTITHVFVHTRLGLITFSGTRIVFFFRTDFSFNAEPVSWKSVIHFLTALADGIESWRSRL